jgi:hypothetical protein
VRDSFLAGRILASGRVARWSHARRAVYAAGSPLIPFVLVWRLRGRLRALGGGRRVTLALAAVATAIAAGEMSGYVVPARPHELRTMIENELRRELLLSGPLH